MIAQDEALAGAYLFDDRHDGLAYLSELRLEIQQWHLCHGRLEYHSRQYHSRYVKLGL